MNARQRRKRERWKERVSKNESTFVPTNTANASKNQGWKRFVTNYFDPENMDHTRNIVKWVEKNYSDSYSKQIYGLEPEPKSFFK